MQTSFPPIVARDGVRIGTVPAPLARVVGPGRQASRSGAGIGRGLISLKTHRMQRLANLSYIETTFLSLQSPFL